MPMPKPFLPSPYPPALLTLIPLYPPTFEAMSLATSAFLLCFSRSSFTNYLYLSCCKSKFFKHSNISFLLFFCFSSTCSAESTGNASWSMNDTENEVMLMQSSLVLSTSNDFDWGSIIRMPYRVFKRYLFSSFCCMSCILNLTKAGLSIN